VDGYVDVAAADDVAGEPVAVRVGDAAVVLFRDRSGRVGALPDRCPHRDMPLSSGSVGFFGELVCGYHGWAWDVDGTCVRIPMSHATMRPAQARLAPFEVAEHGGRVWVAAPVAPVTPID
jgi:renierapurpurin 18,18'-hydroxylase